MRGKSEVHHSDLMGMTQNTSKKLNNAILETLEVRQMMSASPAFTTPGSSNGVLTVSENSNVSSKVTVDYGNTNAKLVVDAGGVDTTYATSAVKELKISTGYGNDYIYINPNISINAMINSGDGNDNIHSGAGNDTIIAGNGNDLIYGKTGNNDITAGNGNDTLMGDRGNDILVAGNGNDSIVSGGGTDVMRPGTGHDTLNTGSANVTITNGGGKYTIIGKGTVTGAAPAATTTTTSTSKTTTAPTTTATTTTATTATTATKTSTTNPTTITATTKAATTPTAPTTTTAPTATTAPTVANNGNPATRPTATIVTLAGTRQTGMVVNVNGLTSKVGTGSAITTHYDWNFGDPNGVDNTITGFNAAHVYDQAGTYTISLTVTNQAGQVSTTTTTVTVAAAARNQIFVDPTNGSDSNKGTQAAPLKTLAAAFGKLANNTEILLKAGQTFTSTTSMHINNSNVLIGRYGTGANPEIIRINGNGVSTIASYAETNGLTIQDITFNSPYAVAANAQAPKTGVSGIYAGGTNIAVRDCTFLNVDDAVNEKRQPSWRSDSEQYLAAGDRPAWLLRVGPGFGAADHRKHGREQHP